MEAAYENIKSLIVSETWEGNMVKLKFKAKGMEQPIETMGMAMPDQEEMMKKLAAEMAKSTASNMAINQAGKGLDALLGTSGVGSLAGNVANQAGLGYQMDVNKMMAVDLTDAVKQKTILTAFSGLQMYFEYKDGEWHYKNPAV